MKSLYISWRNLIARPLSTGLNIILLSMGIALVSALLLAKNQFTKTYEKNINGIDLVVGAKGSPLQLILASVFHIDNPTGNIALKDFERIKKNRLVKKAIPLSYGDNYKGFRIVGTTHDYIDLYQAKIAEGSLWTKPLQVAIGHAVAQRLGLKIGSHFHSAHGLEEDGHHHDHHDLTVTAILEPTGTVIDQVIVTDYKSLWTLHGQSSKDENLQLTAGILQFKNAMGLMQLPRIINEQTKMQAASPVYEMQRLLKLSKGFIIALQALGFGIILVAALSIFIGLLKTLTERLSELAFMRAMGATKWQVALTLIGEVALLISVSIVIGLLISRLFLNYLPHHSFFSWSLISEELFLIGVTILIGLVTVLIPIIRVYRMNIIEGLK